MVSADNLCKYTYKQIALQFHGGNRHIVSRHPEEMMLTNCAIPLNDLQKGNCVITLELYQPQTEDITISCEVSGERPYFRIKRKDLVVEKFGKTFTILFPKSNQNKYLVILFI